MVAAQPVALTATPGAGECAMTRLNRGYEYRSRVGSEVAGITLLDYLTERYPHFSRDDWLERIRSGSVLLDGKPTRQDVLLKPGQITSWLRPPWVEPEVPLSFAVLYREAVLLAVAKPAGLPTVPAGGVFLEHTLLRLVRRHFPGVSPLHRLGRGTSGIVLFARTSEAHAIMSREWRSGAVLKVYRALASGLPECDAFSVEVPIGLVPHPLLKSIYAASSGGKPARSDVKVLERRAHCALVEVRISTGRPHQIRVHLAAAGHPLVGDPLYLAGGVPAPDSRALPGDPGYFLHAGLLGFTHPDSGEWIEIACLPPPLLRLQSEPGGPDLY
jgi:23S rRNA pseudouridine1911/1915/1917 synthase